MYKYLIDSLSNLSDAYAGDYEANTKDDATYNEEDVNKTANETEPLNIPTGNYNDTAEASTVCSLKICKNITQGELNKLKDAFGDDIYDTGDSQTVKPEEVMKEKDAKIVVPPSGALSFSTAVHPEKVANAEKATKPDKKP